jgi:hypothetical protein
MQTQDAHTASKKSRQSQGLYGLLMDACLNGMIGRVLQQAPISLPLIVLLFHCYKLLKAIQDDD